jgi:Icc-related predicted phosphoesterase
MRLKLLLLSDTHAAFSTISQILSENLDSDLIIHSGDFANIKDQEKHLSSAQSSGYTIFTETISLLQSLNKPIVLVPGNVIFT